MTFGERLYQLRKEKKISQEELAEQLNVSRQSVSRWENGTATPDFEKVVRLSSLFGVTTDYLLKGEDAPSFVPLEKQETLSPWRKVLSIVLLVLSGISVLYGWFFGGYWDYYLYVSLPLLILGVLLLFSKKRTLLRSLWTLYISGTNLVYVTFSSHWTGAFLLFREILPGFRYQIYSGWFLFALLLAIVLYTARTFSKYPIRNSRLHLLFLCLMPPAYLLWLWISHLLSKPLFNLVLVQSSLYQFYNILLGFVPLSIITAFAVLLAQRLHNRRK